MDDNLSKISEWIAETHLQEQLKEVDIVGLFTNPWFLVPFIILVSYFLYKQEFKNLLLTGVFVGIWWLTGTEYMNSLVIGDQIQAKKIIPVVLGGAVALAFLIYIFFGRSD